MDTHAILVALNEPDRKDAMIKELLDNVKTVKDENGEQQELVSLNGLCFNAKHLRPPVARTNVTRTISLRDDDIILATCPKTGSHWLSNILTFLLAKGPIDDKPTVQLFDLDIDLKQKLDAVPSPRILHTHMIPQLLPRGAYKEGRKIVLVFRNPKDTAVSLYYFLKKDIKISLKRFLEHYMEGSWLFYNFFDYYKEWENFIHSNSDVSVYIVIFENLRMNGIAELKNLQRFFGLNHSDKRLQEILDKCSLANLKTEVLERKCVSPFFDEEVLARIYRKGEVGNWKTHFTVALSELMDATIAQKFQDSIFKQYATLYA